MNDDSAAEIPINMTALYERASEVAERVIALNPGIGFLLVSLVKGKPVTRALPVIRLESGYEDEVIWFPGPVSYEESKLSPSLISDLKWWHRRIEGTTNQTDHFGPFGGPIDIADAGQQFAERIADEVGQRFQVELWFEGLRGAYRSRRPATNPAAEQFFTSRIDGL